MQALGLRATVVVLFMSSCATSRPRVAVVKQARTYENQLIDEPTCFQTGPCHSYRLQWNESTAVTVRLKALDVALAFSVDSQPRRKMKLEAGQETSLEVVPYGELSLIVGTADDDGRGSYSLVIVPAPDVEIATPPSKEAREQQRREEHRRRDELARRQAEAREASLPKSAREKQRLCKGETATLYFAARRQGSIFYYFCDDTMVTRVGATLTVSLALGGSEYLAFTHKEQRELEVAEHNASVLQTPAWERRAAEAKLALEKRDALYISRFKLRERYLKIVRNTDIVIHDDG